PGGAGRRPVRRQAPAPRRPAGSRAGPPGPDRQRVEPPERRIEPFSGYGERQRRRSAPAGHGHPHQQGLDAGPAAAGTEPGTRRRGRRQPVMPAARRALLGAAAVLVLGGALLWRAATRQREYTTTWFDLLDTVSVVRGYARS